MGTPKGEPDRGDACCGAGGAVGSTTGDFRCGAIVGDDKAQSKGP